MKIVLVGVGSFVTGFLLAATAAGVIHKERLHAEIDAIKEEYKALADSAVEEYKESIEAEWERIEAEKAEEEFRSKPENQVVEGPDGLTYADQLGEGDELTIEGQVYEIIEKQGYTAYNTPVKQPKGATVSTPAISEIPVKITFEEFDLTPKDYEQYVLTYHMGNNKLVSQTGKVIDGKDLIRTVGDLLGSFEEGKDAIYVRNPKLKMDFEVVRVPTSYEDE